MPAAAKRLVLLPIVATDTHYGAGWDRCPHIDGPWRRCNGFAFAGLDLDTNGQFKRLPECIAAERKNEQ